MSVCLGFEPVVLAEGVEEFGYAFLFAGGEFGKMFVFVVW